MQFKLSAVILFSITLLAMNGFSQESPARIEAGDKAPDFSLMGSDGQQYSLEQFVGKQGVVLAWFPKAFTRG